MDTSSSNTHTFANKSSVFIHGAHFFTGFIIDRFVFLEIVEF